MLRLSKIYLLIISLLVFTVLSACATAENEQGTSQSGVSNESGEEAIPKNLVGSWDCDADEYSIVFFDDGRFETHTSDNIEPGTYTYNAENGDIELTYDYLADGTYTQTGFAREENAFYLEIADPISKFVRVDEISYAKPVLANPIVGIWDNMEISTSLFLLEDGTYELIQDSKLEKGTYSVDESSATFTMTQESGEQRNGNYDDTVLYIDGFGGYFYTTLSADFDFIDDTASTWASDIDYTAPSTIVGAWDNDEAQFSLSFYESGRFVISSTDSTESGTYTYDSSSATVVMTYEAVPEDFATRYGYIDANGYIYLDELSGDADYFYNVDQRYYTQTLTQSIVEYSWNNDDHAWSIVFSDDGTYEILAHYGVESSGTFVIDESSGALSLMDSSGMEISAVVAENVLYIDDLSGTGAFYANTSALYSGESSNGR